MKHDTNPVRVCESLGKHLKACEFASLIVTNIFISTLVFRYHGKHAFEPPTYPDAKAFCEALITAGILFHHRLLRGNNETAAGRF